jgi:hypothetical protein
MATAPMTNRIATAANSAQPCLVADHDAKGSDECRRNQQHRDDFDDIGQRGGVLERVGTIALKAPPPSPDISLIDSQDATGHRGSSGGRRQSRDLLCTMEIVDHSEDEQYECDDDRQWQQNAHHRPHQIYPEVADFVTLPARQPTNQGDGDAHPYGATCERLHPKACGQADMPERGFAGVILPAGIARK